MPAHKLHTQRDQEWSTPACPPLTMRITTTSPTLLPYPLHSHAFRHMFAVPDNRSLDNFAIGVMGDLHLEPDAQFMRQFEAARGQMRRHIGAEGAEAAGARVVQLGDLGGYTSRPGSRQATPPTAMAGLVDALL